MYALLLTLLLASCSHHNAPLSVQTEYWRQKDLASYVVDTPDPQKQQSVFGQRIRIAWSANASDRKKGPLSLEVTVRLKNSDELHKTYQLQRSSGELIFPVVGSNFSEKGGILSYSIALKAGTETIAERKHRFWVEKIKVE